MAIHESASGGEIDLMPTEFGRRGDGIARDPDGQIFSIPGAVPGEPIRVKAMARRRGLVHARVVEVLDPSAHRVSPPCPEVANGCGACQWQHIDLDAQVEYKRDLVSKALGLSREQDIARLHPTVRLPAQDFRTTVDAAVSRGRAGLRRYRSHRVVEVDQCQVAHPLLEDLLVHGNYGDATDVLLRCGARTGERLVMPTPLGTMLDLPDDVRLDHIHELAAGHTWRISARSFFQTRADGVDALADLVSAAAGEIEPATRALDLYSGVGVFAGVLAHRGWSVTAVEMDRSAVEDARVNLHGLPVSALRADVSKWKAPKVDLVVADPSRAGLEKRGVEVVTSTRARRVILISCDVTSLGKDAALLRKAGYSLSYVTPVDLFPHTFHVEVVSVYDR